MSSAAEKQRQSINIWTARCMPVILAGTSVYATYVLVGPLCVDYLLAKHNNKAAAIPIIIIHFILFFFMVASQLRLVYLTVFDPPYLPLGPSARLESSANSPTRKETSTSGSDSIGAGEYNASKDEKTSSTPGAKDDPNSPGLELFYIKDIFVCERDGKPRWCSYCANWKPDRTHHCRDSGRCIYKMDHFCPWVGGPVGETNFKFFLQYTFYTSLYCLFLLIVMAYYVARQIKTRGERYDPQLVAILGIATFFFLFTGGMSGTSINLIIDNVTQVEKLALRSRVHTFAILKPLKAMTEAIDPSIAVHPRYSEITYPLLINEPTTSSQTPLSDRDMKATRTFAILDLAQGKNPWRLGSRYLNWKLVMGTTVVDWFLPIRRSPCCDHQDAESQFRLGPAMDEIRLTV